MRLWSTPPIRCRAVECAAVCFGECRSGSAAQSGLRGDLSGLDQEGRSSADRQARWGSDPARNRLGRFRSGDFPPRTQGAGCSPIRVALLRALRPLSISPRRRQNRIDSGRRTGGTTSGRLPISRETSPRTKKKGKPVDGLSGLVRPLVPSRNGERFAAPKIVTQVLGFPRVVRVRPGRHLHLRRRRQRRRLRSDSPIQ